MEILSNLTLEIFNQPFLLEKRIELLIAIQKTGSISKAAKEVPMSYKAAWEAAQKVRYAHCARPDMEQGNDKPGREKGDPLLYGRISLALKRGTDRRLQRGDLEAFP